MLRSWLNLGAFSRLRRNHGLEHASIHMLSRKNPRRAVAGYSDPNGFWLLGDLSLEEVNDAVSEALRRMRSGERSLAIHPNCGTNLVTTAISTGVAGALAMSGTRNDRERLERLPLAAVLAAGALFLAKPLGTRIQQQITTSGDPGNLQVIEIRPAQRGRFKAHRINTRA
jgi:hypothetical protein